MAQAPVRPLIAVVGATGMGKSDLAVELARKYDGEIINGDAMQLYHGLPIITNKISADEMKSVPHHLLGCIGLEEETWTVSRFVEKALSAIDNIRSRGKLPILVGGTHYYTQSLLFRDTLADTERAELSRDSNEFPILDEPTEIILAKLKEVDPVMAGRWHPNDRRKIRRSLEMFLKTGKPASQTYAEQRIGRELSPEDASGSLDDGSSPMRFPTLIFWMHSGKDTLYPRLDGRVDKMLERGLLGEVDELTAFRQDHEARTGTVVDQTRGIWVSIGYKEFLDYHDELNADDADSARVEKLKLEAIGKTQAATRQYANRQIKWIRIKMLNAMAAAGQSGNVYLLDGSDLSEWEDNVLQPARSVTRKYLEGEERPSPSSLSPMAAELLAPKRGYDLSQRPDLWQKRTCEACGTVAVTENDWNRHIKSRGHRRAAAALQKKQALSTATAAKGRDSVQADVVDVLEDYVNAMRDDEAA